MTTRLITLDDQAEADLVETLTVTAPVTPPAPVTPSAPVPDAPIAGQLVWWSKPILPTPMVTLSPPEDLFDRPPMGITSLDRYDIAQCLIVAVGISSVIVAAVRWGQSGSFGFGGRTLAVSIAAGLCTVLLSYAVDRARRRAHPDIAPDPSGMPSSSWAALMVALVIVGGLITFWWSVGAALLAWLR
jgi:hypothetical protein